MIMSRISDVTSSKLLAFYRMVLVELTDRFKMTEFNQRTDLYWKNVIQIFQSQVRIAHEKYLLNYSPLRIIDKDLVKETSRKTFHNERYQKAE